MPDFEKATGHKVTLSARHGRRADPSGSKAARSFDLAVLTPEAIDESHQEGQDRRRQPRQSGARSASASWSRRARRGPTSARVDAFKKALLAAKSVAYIDPQAGGSSGIYVAGLLVKLGIADAIKPKAVLIHGGAVAEHVANGEAEIGIHQISEILPVKGITLVGPLPKEIQNYTTYAAGLGANAKAAEAAKALIDVHVQRQGRRGDEGQGHGAGGLVSACAGRAERRCEAGMTVAVKALFFDVFGTLVDWRTSIAREAEIVLKPLGHALDWLAFADAWRGEYQGAMDQVRDGHIPFVKLDVLHRQNLDKVMARSASRRRKRCCATSISPGTGSMPGPTCRPGLARLKRRLWLAPVSNGNISLMVDLARRNGMPWDAILGSEIAGDYKPKPRVYLRACEAFDLPPGRVHDGRGAQQRPLARGGAAACAPPTSRARTNTARARASARRRVPVDFAANSLEDLAPASSGCERVARAQKRRAQREMRAEQQQSDEKAQAEALVR